MPFPPKESYGQIRRIGVVAASWVWPYRLVVLKCSITQYTRSQNQKLTWRLLGSLSDYPIKTVPEALSSQLLKR